MRFSTRVALALTVTALSAIAGSFLAMRIAYFFTLPKIALWAFAALLVTPVVLLCIRAILQPLHELRDDLGNALRATRDGDHSLRLVVRGDREIAELKRLYNEVADAVRIDRHEIHNKEILLDTILQRTPVAVVLVNDADRVIYSNAAARELIADGARIDGRLLSEIAENVQPALRDVLFAPADAIFHSGDETFHLGQREFRMHTQEHRLILLERLTPELRRQEVTVWKKAIRLINHEINNSIAPISSLFHSARRAQEMPEHRHRLEEIYGLIQERLEFLREFLDAYAQFARLPEPHKERTVWSDVFEPVRALYPFRVEGHPELDANIDRAQLQQVVINLVKNAHESGSAPEEVVVSIQRAGDDCVLRVVDRGPGMPEEVIRQALVPFYTTKPNGTGLGLALCNEIVEAHGGRMRLAAREGGGTVVTCWVPA
ncbi:MAG TPA: ATP-binding protein [Thermoanaerobaculia bacterium]|nr:ATP-binding protein [Thermoanaerobaculia bacterium]